MRRVDCEQCGTSVQTTEYGIPPVGWVQILIQGPLTSAPPDFCSERCAQRWLELRAIVKARA